MLGVSGEVSPSPKSKFQSRRGTQPISRSKSAQIPPTRCRTKLVRALPHRSWSGRSRCEIRIASGRRSERRKRILRRRNVRGAELVVSIEFVHERAERRKAFHWPSGLQRARQAGGRTWMVLPPETKPARFRLRVRLAPILAITRQRVG